jgi:hypothetical protein
VKLYKGRPWPKSGRSTAEGWGGEVLHPVHGTRNMTLFSIIGAELGTHLCNVTTQNAESAQILVYIFVCLSHDFCHFICVYCNLMLAKRIFSIL